MAALYPGPFARFWISPNKPNNGGKVFFYENGTTTLKNTWSDSGLSSLNANPLILDSDGNFQVQVFANASDVFSVEVKDSADVVTQVTIDDVFFVSEFAITSALVVAALAANTGALDLAGTQIIGASFAAFADNLDLTAAGSIDASAGAITLGSVTGLTTFDAGITSTGDATVNSGDLIIGTSGNGIDFSATSDGSGTTTSEILDDYEEGTWVPVLSDGINNATSDGSESGTYTKIGDRVFLTCHIKTTSLGSVSGDIRITGLPFTPSGGTPDRNGIAVGLANGLSMATAGFSPSGFTQGALTFIQLYLWDGTAGNSAMQASEWSADGGIWFSTSYET